MAAPAPAQVGQKETSAADILDLTLSSDDDEPVVSKSQPRHAPPPPPLNALAANAVASESAIKPFATREGSPARRAPVTAPASNFPSSPPPSSPFNVDKGKEKKRSRPKSPEGGARKRVARSLSSTSSSSVTSSQHPRPAPRCSPASASSWHASDFAKRASPPQPSSSVPSHRPAFASSSHARKSTFVNVDSHHPPVDNAATCASDNKNFPRRSASNTFPRPPGPTSSSTSSPASAAPTSFALPSLTHFGTERPYPAAPDALSPLPLSSSRKAPGPPAQPHQPRTVVNAPSAQKLKVSSPRKRTLLRHPRDPSKTVQCRAPPPPPPLPSASTSPGSLPYLLARHPKTPIVSAAPGFVSSAQPAAPPRTWEEDLEERWEWLSAEVPDAHTAAHDTVEAKKPGSDDTMRVWKRDCGPEDWDLQDEEPRLEDRRWAPWEELPFRCTPMDGSGVLNAYDAQPMNRSDRLAAEKEEARKKRREKKAKGKGKEKEKPSKSASFGFVRTHTFNSGSGGPSLFESLERIEDLDQSTDSEDETDTEEERAPAPWFSTMAKAVARTERRRLKREEMKKEGKGRGKRKGKRKGRQESGSSSPER
ncbi:hypothetical protein JCM11251_002600 [Rhodosporidiobolus azoricus]